MPECWDLNGREWRGKWSQPWEMGLTALAPTGASRRPNAEEIEELLNPPAEAGEGGAEGGALSGLMKFIQGFKAL